MKINRIAVYKKFEGHCAYCGRPIDFKAMQIDHYWPQFLAHFYPELDNNRFDNLMPSCQKCNIHKHGTKPEIWRKELARQITMMKKNAQFDRVLRFNQISIHEKPIVFYFERVAQQKDKEKI